MFGDDSLQKPMSIYTRRDNTTEPNITTAQTIMPLLAPYQPSHIAGIVLIILAAFAYFFASAVVLRKWRQRRTPPTQSSIELTPPNQSQSELSYPPSSADDRVPRNVSEPPIRRPTTAHVHWR
jgi:hypothetical protein